jgi:hypothetical protein
LISKESILDQLQASRNDFRPAERPRMASGIRLSHRTQSG